MNRPSPYPLTDRIFRWGFFFLLLFVPLAFGSVEPWARAVLTVVIALLGVLWAARELALPEESRMYRRRTCCREGRFTALSVTAGVFLMIPVIQIVPLPAKMLNIVSPGSKAVLDMTTGGAIGTVSVLPSLTVHAAVQYATMLFLFFLALNTLRGREDIRWAARLMIIAGFCVAFFGIVQRLAWNGKIFWVREISSGGAFGPFVNRNHFAGWLIMIIPLGVGYLLSLDHRCDERVERESVGRKIMVAFAVAIMTGALFMSLSRGGMVALSAAFMLIGAALAVKGGTGRRLYLFMGTAFSAGLIAFWLGDTLLLERLGTLTELGSDRSTGTRMMLWKDSLAIVRDFPLLGSGLGTFDRVFPLYKSFTSEVSFNTAHNDYLQLMTESGALGFAAAAAVIALYFSCATGSLNRRHDREVLCLGLGAVTGVGAFLLHASTTSSFQIPANAVYFAFLAALSLKISVNRRGSPPG